MGESLRLRLPAGEAYALWAPRYDAEPNPLTALEGRVVASQLGSVSGLRFLDLGCGTGRWMKWAQARGAMAFGADRNVAMLHAGGPAGRTVAADLSALPFADKCADIAICSLSLAYVTDLQPALQAMARVARRLVISDMHPQAEAAGWQRSFRVGGQTIEIEHQVHSRAEIESILGPAEWFVEPGFGEPERFLFDAAGKHQEFTDVGGIPAIYAGSWVQA
jgi:ubiquinone/menaquinone biosynthesis C-methylase UbiE